MNLGGVNFLLEFEHTKEAKRVLSVERGGGWGGVVVEVVAYRETGARGSTRSCKQAC